MPTFERMRALQIFVTLASCVIFAGAARAAGIRQPLAEQLIGRWVSTSFVATNFDVFSGDETNLILCVYEVEQQWTNPATRKYEASLDVELRTTDRTGRERPVSDAGNEAWLRDTNISFGGIGGFGFKYSLTNGVLRFEKSEQFTLYGVKHRMHVFATLAKVSGQPGERLLKWRAEPQGTANVGPPIRSETNGAPPSVGSEMSAMRTNDSIIDPRLTQADLQQCLKALEQIDPPLNRTIKEVRLVTSATNPEVLIWTFGYGYAKLQRDTNRIWRVVSHGFVVD